ncbi:histidine--tRNA ligase [Candidatus Pacearchaeota archaeon]|nr:histidine--tRNA ligase [Candidatus Pacearchaeota archaeon]
MARVQSVKGFQDFVGADAIKRESIKKIIQEQFELYGFEPAETPIIESVDFIGKEDSGDEAVRDVFRLEDRGKRKLGLRYEFTFQLKRIAKNQKLPYKRFQIGYNFRDEPIRKGRTRQFIQCDADVVGSTLKEEAEMFKMISKIFEKLKMPTKIYINNRKLINEILVSENIEEKNREQVIRELDKLDKLLEKEVADNLKKINAEKILKIFTGKESDFEKYNFYKEIKELKQLCKNYNVDVIFRPFLARGLSYYNGTVFEIWSDDLDVSISGGGAYLIGDIQSFGVALGFEPIFLLAGVDGQPTKVQIISINQNEEAIALAESLRDSGISVNLLLDKAIGKAMEYANTKETEKVIFVGKDEVANKTFKVKDMKIGEEKFLTKKQIIELY